MHDILGALLADLDQPPPTATDGPLPAPPPERGRRRRGLKVEPQLVTRPAAAGVTVDAARVIINQAMRAYIDLEQPAHALLISVPPGVGKTYAAVRLAEECARRGMRVLYAGPRHAFFLDVLRCAEHPEWWYEWLPRQREDEATGKTETCRHAPDMASWLARGYDAMDFCSAVCGWDYVNNTCPYHAQKEQTEPIIFGQHQHVVGGHILMESFDVVIGDEYPLGVFLHDWLIPGRHIVPSGMPVDEPITEVLHRLRQLADSGGYFEGQPLMDFIGGARAVAEACESYDLPATASIIAPKIFWPEDVEHVDYGHLPQLLFWLGKEARALLDGRQIEPHVAIINGKLRLLLRHMANAQLPDHRIWLDATANAALYERVIDWPVEQVKPHVRLLGPVYQVWDSTNTRGSLVENGQAAAKAHRVKLQVEHIVKRHGYTRPLIVSYSQLDTLFDGYDFTYFYGNRGTNKYEDCDAVIIIGTPQPSTTELVKDARMLFIDRQTAFDATWCERDLPFAHYRADDGLARSGVVSGFWNDEDLQLVLDQLRMAEIVQSAHRVRPVLSTKPIWLLTSLPVEDLPPTELLSVRELFSAPAGVDPYIWPLIVEYARTKEGGIITSVDLVEAFSVSRVTANNYLEALALHCASEFEPIAAVARKGRGRPAKALRLR